MARCLLSALQCHMTSLRLAYFALRVEYSRYLLRPFTNWLRNKVFLVFVIFSRTLVHILLLKYRFLRFTSSFFFLLQLLPSRPTGIVTTSNSSLSNASSMNGVTVQNTYQNPRPPAYSIASIGNNAATAYSPLYQK